MGNGLTARTLRVAVLIKQIPRFEEFHLGTDGRLIRGGGAYEINPYCRRALKKAVEIAEASGGQSIVITMGPPQAEEALLEALAVGADEAVLVSDPAFAGSDTLATSRVLARTLSIEGPFDLVFCGLNSVDGDTGQVGPEVAELMGMAFVAGARTLEVREGQILARCERDDGWRDVIVEFPAVISAAERLCKPAKAGPEECRKVSPKRVKRLGLAALGNGPWGAEGSPTLVGSTRILEVRRERRRLEGDPRDIADHITDFLRSKKVFDLASNNLGFGIVPDAARSAEESPIGVVLEPGREVLARELLGRAAQIAHERQTEVHALSFEDVDVEQLGSWGADAVIVAPMPIEEDASRVVVDWARRVSPVVVLGPSTSWGREVMARSAASLGAGLIGDAVAIENLGGELVYWKPAFGGQLLAAITCTSSTEMVTVRPGAAPLLEPRKSNGPRSQMCKNWEEQGRITVSLQEREEGLTSLMRARTVVGVGLGVIPDDYWRLDPLLRITGAELAATRKVTDRGWLSRSRQLGVTGVSIAPALYIAFGVSGNFNHMIGLRQAGVVIAINKDPQAPIFDQADLGVVADWRDLIDPLTMKFAFLLEAIAL